ncbi:MAG: acyltransferase [Actinomycetes bacterium]
METLSSAAESLPDITPARVEFPCMDGARAIAALIVVLNHAGTFATLIKVNWAPSYLRLFLVPLGRIGIAAFFVISGFLLYRPFVLAHFRSAPPPKYGAFWLRRLGRILPGYWFALLGAMALGTAHFANANLGDYVLTFGLGQNYRFAGIGGLGIGIAWTLVIEVSFYLVVPFIAWFIRRAGALAGLSALRAQIVWLSTLAAVSIAVKVYWLLFLDGQVQYFRRWFPLSELGRWLPSFMDWFALGMLVAVCSVWRELGGRVPSVISAFAQRAWACWALSAIFLVALTRSGLTVDVWGNTGAVTGFLYEELSLVAGFFLVFPALLPGERSGRVRRLLASRVFVFLGTVSFGIYLWNDIIGEYLLDHRPFPTLFGHIATYVLLITVLSIVIAYFAFVLIERPARDLVQRIVGSTRSYSDSKLLPHWRIGLSHSRKELVDWVDVSSISVRSGNAIVLGALVICTLFALLLPTLRGLMA